MKNHMKRKKRVLSLLLALLLSLATLHAGTLLTHADTFFEEGDFRFAVTSGERLLVAQYKGSDTDVALPDSVGGRAVTGVYKNCFQNTAVESVTLPEGYTAIGAFAFNGCTALAEITLPSTLESFGIMAFSGCTALAQVDFSAAESLEAISFAAFNGCTSLQQAILPDSLTSLGENAFCNCTALSQIGLPENLTEIPEYAFYGTARNEKEHAKLWFKYLHDGDVPDTVTAVGKAAFGADTEIVCFEGSAAAQYCADNGVTNARVLEKTAGDANTDGHVNVNDVTAIQRSIAELEVLPPYAALLADVDRSGAVNVDDATRIQMYLAEFDVTLG